MYRYFVSYFIYNFGQQFYNKVVELDHRLETEDAINNLEGDLSVKEDLTDDKVCCHHATLLHIQLLHAE